MHTQNDSQQLAAEAPEQTEYRAPIPSRANKNSVFEFAERQRKQSGIRSGFDLPELVKANGGEIAHIGIFDADQTDAIVVEADGSFKIYLSSLAGGLRDNFTIAHELGHYLLHWPRVQQDSPGSGMRATRSVDDSDEDLVRCEWEANWFASAFLMPSEEFAEAYRDGIASQRFGVSQSAVNIRAKVLGLQ